jgi:hypothetical protein
MAEAKIGPIFLPFIFNVPKTGSARGQLIHKIFNPLTFFLYSLHQDFPSA